MGKEKEHYRDLRGTAPAAGSYAVQELATVAVSAAAGDVATAATAATAAPIIAGLLITALFFAFDNANKDNKTSFEKMLEKFYSLKGDESTRGALNTPVAFVISMEYEPVRNYHAKVYDVIPWDGTTVSAVGGQYYYGQYNYLYTCEEQLGNMYETLLDVLRKEFGYEG